MLDQQQPNAPRAGLSRVLVIILIVAVSVLAYVQYLKRIQVTNELQRLTMQMEQLRTGNDPQNIAVAAEIVEKVKKHITIPGDIEPTVATIVDIEALKSTNDFYKNAKNGDNLIVTPSRAILYDPDLDIIIDVVPVQLEAPAASAAAEASSQAPAEGE